MENYAGPERRKFPRLNINLVVTYHIKQQADSYDLTQTKNVGGGGMLLTTNCYFEKGTILELTIRFPFFVGKTKVDGEVVDCKEIVKNIIYETRIKFLNLDKDIFDKLNSFIKDKLKI